MPMNNLQLVIQHRTVPPLMKQLAIRLGHQKTMTKSLVMQNGGLGGILTDHF